MAFHEKLAKIGGFIRRRTWEKVFEDCTMDSRELI